MDQFKIVEYAALNEEIKSLLKHATAIREKAYIPYSNFAVGAALLTEDDSKVYTGCNIENSTLSPTICAERAAISRAVCDGYIKFSKVAVIAHQTEFTAPCGVCRQTLNEFRSANGDMEVYLSRPALDQVLCTKLSQILPLSFVSYKKDNGGKQCSIGRE